MFSESSRSNPTFRRSGHTSPIKMSLLLSRYVPQQSLDFTHDVEDKKQPVTHPTSAPDDEDEDRQRSWSGLGRAAVDTNCRRIDQAFAANGRTRRPRGVFAVSNTNRARLASHDYLFDLWRRG